MTWRFRHEMKNGTYHFDHGSKHEVVGRIPVQTVTDCPCTNSNAIAYQSQMQLLTSLGPPTPSMHLLKGTSACHAALRPPAIVDANINMPTCLRLPQSDRFARSAADDVALTFNFNCYDDIYNSHHNGVLLRPSALGHY